MSRKVIGLIAALAILLSAAQTRQASASQASCVMPTTGTVSGLTLVNDINACNQSILSVFSGATAPALPNAGMLWFDTSTNYVRQYDGSAWLALWYVDAANHLITAQIGGGTPNATINIVSGVADLGSVPQSSVAVSGSGSITSFGSSATIGTIHTAGFAGTPTLVHSPPTLTLPGGLDIIVEAGDVLLTFYQGSGHWKVISYGTLSRSPRAAAVSFMGNPSPAGRATPSDMSLGTLSQKVTPIGADKFPVWDSAGSNQIKWVTMSSLAAIVGVTSIAGNTGAFTLGTCMTNSTNVILMNCFVFNSAASKADQQAGSSNVVGVTPLHQQDHKSAAKAWGSFNGGGSTLASYNASVSAHGTAGVYTVTFSTPFSSANFSCAATAAGNNTVYFGAKTASTIVVNTVQLGSSPIGADVAFDLHCFGDQ